MKCSQCGTVNPAGRRFCGHCGAPLRGRCAACGFVNAPRDRFCGGCGQPLAQSADAGTPRHSARVPERRQLTVMFCDAVGSTALSHRLDPEDLRAVIGNYQEKATQAIARYEGFVARYLGDGILAYFGYPRAHENDAVRAIDAALEIVETLERAEADDEGSRRHHISARIGIATGVVVVGDWIGEQAIDEASVVGETPNVASRIQALAKPNSVVIAQSTRDLAGGTFEYADLGSHRLKGVSKPVPLYRVTRASEARTRFDAAHEGGLSPFVGREAELDRLSDVWQRARAGHGQVVLLTGEAGMGKSRMAERFWKGLRPALCLRIVLQCSPYRANSALYPFIRELERVARFARRDSAAQRLGKLEAAFADGADDRERTITLLAALLSVPTAERYPPLSMSADQQKEETFGVLLHWMSQLASQAPLILLLEDAHWIDPTSNDLLDRAVERIRNLPVLAIVTSRTTSEYAWGRRPHAHQIQLERFDRAESLAMVQGIIGSKRLPTKLVAQIVDRTDGIPLFVEELTHAIAAPLRARRTGKREAIPATLQDSLMARLDQLGPAREVAQAAAVIGREFRIDLLAAVSPLAPQALREALAAMTAAAIAFDRGEPPGTTFVFKHALVQDAAYASLLRSKRQALHEKIAQTFEKSHPERVKAEPELIAHHYTEAGRPLVAARYWAAAARRAVDSSASVEALGHASSGLALLADAPASPERDAIELPLQVLRGAACRAVRGFASSDAERSFLRARDLCESLGEARAMIDVRRGLFSCYYARGALALARDQAELVALAGEAMSDAASKMLGHWMLGCVTFWQGEFATAQRELEQAYALYEPGEQRAKTLALQIDPAVNALCHLSWAHWILGYPDRALATSHDALAIARQLEQPFAVAMALFFACTTRACCGHHQAVRPLLDELKVVTSTYKLRYLESCARVLEAQALIAAGRYAAAVAEIGVAAGEFAAQEAGVGMPWALSIAVDAHARLGARDKAAGMLAMAFDAVRRNGEHHWEAELLRMQGELSLDDAQAQASFERAISLARMQSARSLELRAALSLARLFERQGKTDAARSLLRDTGNGFTDGFDTEDMRTAGIAGEGQTT